MSDLLQKAETLPPLTPIVGLDADVETLIRRNVSDALRSPAFAAMAELALIDPNTSDAIGAFRTRTEDFRRRYDRPGRSVAPWLAGIAHTDTDLLDTTIHAHFESGSEATNERLRRDASDVGLSFWPAVVLGSGPQGQVFLARLEAERPDLARNTLMIDDADDSGGTFRESGGMDFRINSRVRPEDSLEQPIPGTRGNINPLAPGLMTVADSTAEVYPSVKVLGRMVRLNEAVTHSDVVMGQSLVGIVPDRRGSGERASVDLIFEDKQGERYTVRTNLLAAAGGGGKEDFSRFDKPTQELIRAEKEKLAAGERPTVITYSDLYRLMNSDEMFPLKGVADVAVIGDRDGGRTATGTLLGYEPRKDGSVTQIDWVEKLTWYGQDSMTFEDFVEENRLRYGQLGLDFPRREGARRFSRIEPVQINEIDSIALTEDGKAIIDGNEQRQHDLVVVATGFKNEAEKWLADSFIDSTKATDEVVQNALSATLPDELLEVGTVIDFPLGVNIRQIQILSRNDGKKLADTTYSIGVTTIDGIETFGRVLAVKGNNGDDIALSDYCSLEQFDGVANVYDDAKGTEILGDANAEFLGFNGFSNLSDADRLDLLKKKPFVVRASNDLYRNDILLQIVEVDEDTRDVTFRFFDLDRPTGILIKIGSDDTATYDYFVNRIVLGDDNISVRMRSGFLVNSALEAALEKENQQVPVGELMDVESVVNNIRALAQQGAVLKFRNDLTDIFDTYILLVQAPNGDVRFAFRKPTGDNSWRFNTDFDVKDLVTEIRRQGTQIEVISSPEAADSRSEEPWLSYGSRAEFRALSETDKLQALKKDSVIFTNGTTYKIIEDTESLDAIKVQRYRTTQSNGSLESIDVPDVFTLDFLLDMADDFYISNNPALLGTETPGTRVEDIDFDTLEDRLGSLIDAGAVFIGSKAPNNSVRELFFKDGEKAASLYETISGEILGPTTYDFAYEDTKQIVGIIKREGYDRVIIPEPVSRVRASGRLSFKDRSFKPSVITTSRDGVPVAKRVEDQPVFLVGPSAKLPVDPRLIELIPVIPENTQGIFASYPNVTTVSKEAATAFPVNLGVSGDGKAAPTKYNAPKQKPSQQQLERGLDITAESDTSILSSARRMEPSRLLLYALGMRSREIGIEKKVGENTVLKSAATIRFDDDKKTLRLFGVGQDDADISARNIQSMLTSPYATYALRKLLSMQGVTEVRVDLPVDDRGLQLANTKIEVVRPQKARRSRAVK